MTRKDGWVYIPAPGSRPEPCGAARTNGAGARGAVDLQGPPRELRAPPPSVPPAPVQLLPGSAAPGGLLRPRPRRQGGTGRSVQLPDAWIPRQGTQAWSRDEDLRGHFWPDLAETAPQPRARAPVGPLCKIPSSLNREKNAAGWSLNTSLLTPNKRLPVLELP